MNILDIGCGKNKHEGSIGVDHHPVKGVNVVCSVEEGLPFKENKFNKIICSHILEHINNFIPLMEDIHRISKEGSIIVIKVPFFAHEHAYGDPTHLRYFTLNSFAYFTGHDPENYITKARFRILKKRIIWSTSPRLYMRLLNKIFTPLINRFQRLYSYYLCYLLPSEEIHFVLETKKVV